MAMSYSQTMKWGTKHRKGTRQPVIMSTGSGIWLSGAFIAQDYLPYTAECQKLGVRPIDAESLYRHITTTKIQRGPSGYAAMTAAGNL
jgi:hypothetical protein